MRALIQRVDSCSVLVDGVTVGSIGKGMLVLLGVGKEDTPPDADVLAARCSALRIFDDGAGKMNLSVIDMGGEVMVVSQFTLYGDTRRGNRPSYSDAGNPQDAEKLYAMFVDSMRSRIGEKRVATGMFRAMMKVQLVNDGPVTVMVETKSAITS